MKKWRTIFALGGAALAALAAAAPAIAAPRVVDVSREAGVFDPRVHTWSAEAGDVNSDGWDDLIVVNHYEKPAYLYTNRRDGTFARQEIGAKRDRHECAFGDVNNDRLQDFYCSVGGGRGSGRNPNELWIQGPAGEFDNQARQYGVQDLRGRGRDVAFLDANRDGFLDLYVSNHFPRSDGARSRNKLFLNIDGQSFKRAPRSWRINREVGGQIVQALDYDRDGFTDLFVCGSERVHLYRNVSGRRFQDVSRRTRVDEPCESGQMAHMNGDRRPDVVLATQTRLKVQLQRADGTFTGPVYKRKLRGGAEVATGRVDANSREDVYVVQRGRPDADKPDLLLLNRREGRRFVSARIPQTRDGKGDYVVSLDYDRNGRSDFLVMNGFHKHPGPIRLLATRP